MNYFQEINQEEINENLKGLTGKEGTKSEGKNPFQGKNSDFTHFTGECRLLSCPGQSLSRVTGAGQQAGNSPSESQRGACGTFLVAACRVLLSFLGLSFPGHPDSQPRAQAQKN